MTRLWAPWWNKGGNPEKARDLQQSRLKAYRKKKSPKLECEFGAMKKKSTTTIEETFLAGEVGIVFPWQFTWNFDRNSIHTHAWILQVSDEEIPNTPTGMKSIFNFPQYGTQQIHGCLYG